MLMSSLTSLTYRLKERKAMAFFFASIAFVFILWVLMIEANADSESNGTLITGCWEINPFLFWTVYCWQVLSWLYFSLPPLLSGSFRQYQSFGMWTEVPKEKPVPVLNIPQGWLDWIEFQWLWKGWDIAGTEVNFLGLLLIPLIAIHFIPLCVT